MARAAQSCRVSPATRAVLEREHTALHEGLRPSKITCERVVLGETPRAFGVAREIQYAKLIPGQKPDYHHPWKGYAQPTLGVDSAGHIRFAAGRTEVRRRGIEDRVPAGQKASPYLSVGHVQKERWNPPAPSRLVTLGLLRFIRYESLDTGRGGPGAVKTLRFTAATAPTLAHDQHGNLYALGGRYRIPSPGVAPMARRRRRSSRRRHNPFALANPTHSVSRRRSGGSELEKTGYLALTGLGVLAIAGPATVILDTLLAQTAWSAPMKGFAKLGVAQGGFAAASTFLPASFKAKPAVAIGLLAGPGTDAFLDLYNIYAAPAIAQFMAPSPAVNSMPIIAQGNPAIAPTNPAAQAWLPAGAPSAYQAYNAQACAVR